MRHGRCLRGDGNGHPRMPRSALRGSVSAAKPVNPGCGLPECRLSGVLLDDGETVPPPSDEDAERLAFLDEKPGVRHIGLLEPLKAGRDHSV